MPSSQQSDSTRVAVTARSFARHVRLREHLSERYPNAKFNDTGRLLTGEQLLDFLDGQDKVICGLEQIGAQQLAHLPQLKVISKYGVGLDNLDLDALVERGIRVGWKPGINRRAVAELALANALALIRSIPPMSSDMRNGVWQRARGRQLSNQVVGIVGCGHIGQDLVKLLRGFGCKILANDIRNNDEFYRGNNVTSVDLKTLLLSADIVSLHVPLTNLTHNLISGPELEMMKNDACLINTARGGLIDEVALLDALNKEQIFGAALDVFSEEPPKELALFRHPNVIATPHIGGGTEEAVWRMGTCAIEGLVDAVIPTREHFPR